MNNTPTKCKIEIEEENAKEKSNNCFLLTPGTILGPYSVKRIDENEDITTTLKFSVKL